MHALDLLARTHSHLVVGSQVASPFFIRERSARSWRPFSVEVVDEGGCTLILAGLIIAAAYGQLFQRSDRYTPQLAPIVRGCSQCRWRAV